MASHPVALRPDAMSVGATARALLNVFKLRIGLAIMLCALAGIAVTPGPALAGWQVAALAFAVLLSSASAGAFNQYVERDLDVKMARTKNRPFVTGTLKHGPFWLWVIGAMIAASVLAVVLSSNWIAATYVFLGAFTYGVVYTVWLKRHTWWNIVVGGLAGSFAVLAGAAAVSTTPGPEALALAVVLFLWTPPHFWSLAIACRKDYAAAGVPMLPVVVGDARAARAIFASAVLLVGASLVPFFFGLGIPYFAAALAGGLFFLLRCRSLVLRPGRETARAAFLASLVQLSAVLLGAMADVALR
jgi:protoheme IX farnesyltransferase